MRWQIAQFVFCDQQQTLTSANDSVQLEPMMVELLSYFCQNPDKIVSKDLLIEQVWLGRIVSDNAVSKLITKLRKVFADDARQPKFIATFPKKGYKFIARVMPISDNNIQLQANENLVEAISAKVNKSGLKEAPDKPANITSQHLNSVVSQAQPENKIAVITESIPSSKVKSSRLVYISVFFILLLLIGFYVQWQQSQNTQTLSTHAMPLTTDAGDEFHPDFSPDGTRVAYMSVKDDRIHLMIKNVINEAMVEVSHQEHMGVGPASWSHDGKLIAYLVATTEQCQYYIRTVNGLKLGEPKLIHNCPAGSNGKIIFTHDNNRLVYSEKETGSTPYSLFEINLATHQKKRINQPETFLAGNSQFDLHPSENKLLISSPDKQQWEGFYSLDLETEELTLLFKQDAYICCAIWSHSGTRVVLMGEHPAYKLLSYDLTGKDKKVIHSASRQIRSPHRHVNGVDYLFSSGKDNYNVHLMELLTKKQRVIVNDSVDERLATFAHHNNQIAYIGLASGNEEVWLTDTENKLRKKLTQFNDSRHYVDLLWSPEGEYLLALTLNEIHLINSSTGVFERLKIPQSQIRGVSFKSASTIAYSIKEHNQWQVYLYNLANNQVIAENKKWQFIQYHSNAENTLWLDQESQLFSGEFPTPVSEQQISSHNLINARQFNLKKRGPLWFWFERNEKAKIQSYSELTTEISTVVYTDAEHFDIANNQLLFSKIQQVSSNVYQTQSHSQ